MDFDVGALWQSARRLGTGFMAFLPRLLLALLVVLLFYLIAKLVRTVIIRAASLRGHEHTLEVALGRIAQAAIVVIGLLVAATAAFPTFTLGNLVSALGIGSIAIGFAFKDVSQNFLAGILILITKPFRVGDQIIYQGYEGTVEDIQTRATYLKSYDGRRVIIPNSELYTNSVTVNTAFLTRRMQYDVGIGYGDDIERARGIMLAALVDLDGVLPDPAADVIVVDLADSTVTLRARWWSNAYMADILVAQDKVLTRIKHDLQAAGIDLPYPTRQILFHDQTEDTDGDRSRQREGWPANSGSNPAPLGIARELRDARPVQAGADTAERS